MRLLLLCLFRRGGEAMEVASDGDLGEAMRS
jgi:hypothetical protein